MTDVFEAADLERIRFAAALDDWQARRQADIDAEQRKREFACQAKYENQIRLAALMDAETASTKAEIEFEAVVGGRLTTCRYDRRRWLAANRYMYDQSLAKLGRQAKTKTDEIAEDRRRFERGLGNIVGSATIYDARSKYVDAVDRTRAVRLLSIWKFRAAARMPSESANQLADWIDRSIRPYVTNITVVDRRTFAYRLRFVDGQITVNLPSADRRFGRVVDCLSRGGNIIEPPAFRLSAPPWRYERLHPDRFGLAELLLASTLTAPRKDLRRLISAANNPTAAIERSEEELLMPPRRSKRRRKLPVVGLLERWTICLPTVVCYIVLSYIGRYK